MADEAIAIAPAPVEGCICNQSPAWSPDGRLVAFSTRREGPDTEIAVIPVGGGGTTSLTTNLLQDGDGGGLDWSPDGSQLVVARGEDRFDDAKVFQLIAQDGTPLRALVGCGHCYSPDWSPDGTRIAYLSRGGVHVINADGSGNRSVIDSNAWCGVSWSPDGDELAFGNCSYPFVPPEVWLVNADGSNARKLAEGSAPAWSRNGRIAFVRGNGRESEIYVMNPDGTELRRVTNNAVADGEPDWSPDGSRLVFVRTGPNSQELYVVDADGAGEARLTTTAAVSTRLPVEIRAARTGALISSFRTSTRPVGIALSNRFVAVLGRQGRVKRIELFDPTTGTPRGSVRVPRNTSSRISLDGRNLVFSAGKRIWLLDAERRRRSVIGVARTTPIGLSIEGKRIAWAEHGPRPNTRWCRRSGRCDPIWSRIRAVLLS